jgi:hypothetical protein
VMLLLMGFSFDRYWLVVVGPLIAWAALRNRRVRSETSRNYWGLAWTTATLSTFFSVNVVFTHDWLAFNETRWNLVRKLEREGFSPAQIDGGYEVNGWHRSAEDPQTHPRPGGETARWWSERAERFIAVGSRAGMVEVDKASWFSWAVRRPIPIYVLRRESSTADPSSEASKSAAFSRR